MSDTEVQSTQFTTAQVVLINVPFGIGEAEIEALRVGAERAALALMHGAQKGYSGHFLGQGFLGNLDHLAAHLDQAFSREKDHDSRLPSVYHVAARGILAASLWAGEGDGSDSHVFPDCVTYCTASGLDCPKTERNHG